MSPTQFRTSFSVILFTLYTIVQSQHVDLFMKVNEADWEFVKNEMSKLNLYFKEKILPSLYVVEYRGPLPYEDIKKRIPAALSGKIQAIEQVLIHVGNLRQDPEPLLAVSYSDEESILGDALLACKPYFDMGVDDAWAQNYTGKHVVIAVTDVGVDTDIEDLAANIAKNLSINFVDEKGQSDVAPESYPSYPEVSLTDHGNRCAGLIAAIKGNGKCGAGVAYNATIAVIKVFEVKEFTWLRQSSFSDLSLVKGLSHRLQDIHIFSNSWVFIKDFQTLNTAEHEVLKEGAEKGRNGKGTIYVFPAGPVAEGFANSIYSITVNGVGVNGSTPNYSGLSAAVVTSAYGEGGTYAASKLITTSHNRIKCTDAFAGTSASTALISAIIGLALEANPELSWRDVQHLLVKSSDRTLLQERNNFKENAAGYYYHSTFGFGLINALTLVNLAKNWKVVPVQRYFIRKTTNTRNWEYKKKEMSEATVSITCKRKKKCINELESVIIKTTFMSTKEDELEIVIRSPSGTESILMNTGQSTNTSATKRENVMFKSVHFWGEHPEGNWTLVFCQTHIHKGIFKIHSFSLEIYGTANEEYYTGETHELSVSTVTTEAVSTEQPQYDNKYSSTSSQTTDSHSGNNGVQIVVVVCVVIILMILIIIYKTCPYFVIGNLPIYMLPPDQ